MFRFNYVRAAMAAMLLLLPLMAEAACSGDTAVPVSTDKSSCSGNSCVFTATFVGRKIAGTSTDARFLNEADLHKSDVDSSVAFTTFNASTTLTAPAETIAPGSPFALPINWSGEAAAVGAGVYDTPPVTLSPNGLWQSEMSNVPLEYCEFSALAKDIKSGTKSCTSVPYNSALHMEGKWSDEWKIYKQDPDTKEYTVPAAPGEVSCSSSVDGLTANCTSDTNFTGTVRLELKRTLDDAKLGRDAAHMVPVVHDYEAALLQQYDLHAYIWCASNRFYHLSFGDPYPGTMITTTMVTIENTETCTPVPTEPDTACLNPSPAPVVSWQKCGTDVGNYEVQFKRAADAVTQTVTVPASQDTVAIPDELVSQDGNYTFKVRKVGDPAEGVWSDEKVMRIGKLAANPDVNAPSEVPAGTNATVGWTYQPEDLLKNRLSWLQFLHDSTTVDIMSPQSSHSQSWLLDTSATTSAYSIKTYHPMCGSSSVDGSIDIVPNTVVIPPDIHIITNGQDLDSLTVSDTDTVTLTWYSNNTVGELAATSNPSTSWDGARTLTNDVGEVINRLVSGNVYVLSLAGSGPGGTASDSVAITVINNPTPSPSELIWPSPSEIISTPSDIIWPSVEPSVPVITDIWPPDSPWPSPVEPSPSISVEPSVPVITDIWSPSPSASPSASPSVSPSHSPSPTPSPSASPSASPSLSPSPSPNASFSPGPIIEVD